MRVSGAADDHPTRTELEAFLSSELPPERRKECVRHLLRSCTECLATLGLTLSQPPPSPSAYEFPIRRALAAVRSLETARAGASQVSYLSAPNQRVDHREVVVKLERAAALEAREQCEVIFKVARDLRDQDPKLMVLISSLAVVVAESLDENRVEAREAKDIQAQAWAELANARRITSDLVGAEEAFREAQTRFEDGTRSPRVYAGILGHLASLRRYQRRVGESIQLLDAVLDLCAEIDDSALAGRTLILKGISLDRLGHYEAAAAVTTEGLELVDPQDLSLRFIGVHNLISWWVICGEYRQGRELLATMRPLYDICAGPRERLRVLWLEGMISAGLGEYLPAVRAFEEAQAGFAGLAMPYEVALVALDLAALWLENGQLGQVDALLEEVLMTFHALGIRREASAAILLLYESSRQRRVTLELVRQTAKQLQELQQIPVERV